MLLTSSQISMGISSAIVFAFSTILFLSGYILQQQTVRDIESILRPPPDPAATQIVEPVPKPPDNVNWDRVAYIQILQKYRDVCSTAIIFAELARQESKARRVLIYPRTWDRDDSTGSRQRDRNLRLLRKVATRYNISLRPMDVESDTLDSSAVLSLSRLWSLIQFDTIVHLNPSGVVYDAAALDGLFTLDPVETGIHFLAPESVLGKDGNGPKDSPMAIIATPDVTTYQNIKKIHPASLSLAEMTSATGSIPQYSSRLFGQTISYKHTQAESTTSGSMPAYVRFSDPDILGPEYDIPQKQWNAVRPENAGQKAIWEGIYADYRAQRRAICGLDVEPMPKVEKERQLQSAVAKEIEAKPDSQGKEKVSL